MQKSGSTPTILVPLGCAFEPIFPIRSSATEHLRRIFKVVTKCK